MRLMERREGDDRYISLSISDAVKLVLLHSWHYTANTLFLSGWYLIPELSLCSFREVHANDKCFGLGPGDGNIRGSQHRILLSDTRWPHHESLVHQLSSNSVHGQRGTRAVFQFKQHKPDQLRHTNETLYPLRRVRFQQPQRGEYIPTVRAPSQIATQHMSSTF